MGIHDAFFPPICTRVLIVDKVQQLSTHVATYAQQFAVVDSPGIIAGQPVVKIGDEDGYLGSLVSLNAHAGGCDTVSSSRMFQQSSLKHAHKLMHHDLSQNALPFFTLFSYLQDKACRRAGVAVVPERPQKTSV